MIDDPTPLKHPFDFFESPWWMDANKKLCQDGWPTYVMALNCMVRDAKSAYEQLRAENLKLREALAVAIVIAEDGLIDEKFAKHAQSLLDQA